VLFQGTNGQSTGGKSPAKFADSPLAVAGGLARPVVRRRHIFSPDQVGREVG